MLLKLSYTTVIGVLLMACCACNRSQKTATVKVTDVYHGLYSFGPEVKSFKACSGDHEYWVEDQSNKLELEYSGMGFEKPYEPVYVEVQGKKIPSGKEGQGAEYDSTLVVQKLIKITRDIPQECN